MLKWVGILFATTHTGQRDGIIVVEPVVLVKDY